MIVQPAHQPTQAEVTRGYLVVQPLQDNRGGYKRSRVGSAPRQLGPPDLWHTVTRVSLYSPEAVQTAGTVACCGREVRNEEGDILDRR